MVASAWMHGLTDDLHNCIVFIELPVAMVIVGQRFDTVSGFIDLIPFFILFATH